MKGIKVKSAAAAALMVLSSAAGVFAAGNKEAAKKVEIGAVLLDTRHEWFAEVIEGMKKAGTDLNATVKILSSDSDVAKESATIDNLIAQQVDAILHLPSER
jgi:ABC-type sugar transport system substrate-binding protein